MRLNNRQITKFVYASEGAGTVFAGIFLAAYLLGLPSTEVRHSEPIFRTSLSVVGIIFVVLVLVALVLSFYIKKNRE